MTSVFTAIRARTRLGGTMRRGFWAVLLAAAAPLGGAATLSAQAGGTAATAEAGATVRARPLSLEDALRLAEEGSEQVAVARAGVMRAQGQQLQARSEYLPQLGASASYTRTLASEFQGATGDEPEGPRPEPCDPFTPNPALPLEQRVDSLERAVRCASDEDPLAALSGLFRNLPFGRENQYRVGLSFSQNLFAGGRIVAQNRIAAAGRSTAQLALEQARAQLALDVTQAYYDAVLSERLLGIAEATLAQAETTLGQAQLARQVGNQPEFEVLRAQVTRDNQRPVAIQRRADRDLALLRLRQLLNLPATEEIQLTTGLDDEKPAPVARFAAAESAAGDSATARTVVRQAEAAVRVQENLLSVTRSQRLPYLILSSQYGRVAYPQAGLPDWGDSRANWTVGVSLSVPVFTGGRLRGEQMVAQANVLEARARLQQVRELAALDTRSAQEQLAAARLAWQASQGTVQQAQRAYGIAEVRYREGISTQVELSDSRILLQQAQANRALAARNLQLAQARLALLPFLPLGGAPGEAQQGGGRDGAPPQQPQAPRQRATDATFSGFPGTGGQ